MKKIFVTILVLTAAVSLFTSPLQAGSSGWGGGLHVHDGDFGFQFRKDLALGGDINQLTTQLGMVFPSSKAYFTFDMDYHFIIKNDSGTSRFYPLAGLGFKTDFDRFRFGINGGGGANFMLTDKLAAFGEVKYVFTGWDGFAFTLGFYF